MHADAFKRRLDERYPMWRSPDILEASKRELQQPELMGGSARDESTPEVEGQDADQSTEPSPTGADCRCTNHTGPHRLYHDYWWYERNLQKLERCGGTLQLLCELFLKRDPATYQQARRAKESAELAYLAFAREEIPRLQEKICEMTSRHLSHIPYEMLGPDFPALHERERELRTRIGESLQKMSPHQAREQLKLLGVLDFGGRPTPMRTLPVLSRQEAEATHRQTPSRSPHQVSVLRRSPISCGI